MQTYWINNILFGSETIHNTAFHEISNSTVTPALLWLGLFAVTSSSLVSPRELRHVFPPTLVQHSWLAPSPALRFRLLQSTSNDSSSKTVRSRCRPVPPREDSPPLLSCSGGLRPPQVRTTSSLLAALRPLSSSSSVSFVSWTSENPIMHAHEANEDGKAHHNVCEEILYKQTLLETVWEE